MIALIESVHLVERDWNRKQILDMIRNLKQWEIQELFAYWSNRKDIIKDLAHIHFSNLISLHIQGNQIQSVQALANLDMPGIKHIKIQYNNIRLIRVLRKVRWNQLIELSIYRNLIGDHKALTEACLPKVEYLWIHDIDEEEEQMDRFIDPWFSCKLKTENMKQLVILSTQFASQRSVKKVLLKKWESQTIY